MVVRPPRRDAKARGISIDEGAWPLLRVMWMATGMNMARAPILFMKAEVTHTRPDSTNICTARLLPSLRMNRLAYSTKPDFLRLSLTISIAATLITAGFEKPEKASSGGTTPSIARSSKAPRETRSCLNLPQTNMTRARPRVMKTRVWSNITPLGARHIDWALAMPMDLSAFYMVAHRKAMI